MGGRAFQTVSGSGSARKISQKNAEVKRGQKRFFSQKTQVGRAENPAGWLRQMGPMEPVLEGWKKTLDEMCTVLYHEWDWDTYHRFCEEFDRENEGLEQEWENLVLYFLNTYLLGAVYDGDVFGKVKLAVFGVLVIRERCLFVYGTKGKTGREELIKAAWQYSRQVENSDHNLEFLETDFLMNPLFGLHAMLEVLQ